MTARPDLAEIERLLEIMGRAKRYGLLGAEIGCETELAGHVPALLTALKAERARVAELEAALEWRPIESAPPQKVILLWALTDSETGNWKMATGHWCPGFRGEPGQWEWGGHRLQSYSVQPTHWLPLPPPPKERS